MLVFNSPENKFDNYLVLSPGDYSELTRRLAKQVSGSIDDRIDALLVIKKGGMDMATTFFDEFNYHMGPDMKIERILEITASSYTSIGERRDVRLMQKPELSPGWHVLVLDDVNDHGKTLHEVDRYITESCKCKISSATMYKKPHTTYHPLNYFFLEDTEKWIVYPSEARDTMKIIMEEKIPRASPEERKYLYSVIKGIAKQNRINSPELPELIVS
jgi:hypoxanthine phosphoribosyltransferase